MGSAFIPSTFTKATHSHSADVALPQSPAASCEACRISGTLTFAAVGAYALTVARQTAKTPATRNGAVVVGLGFWAAAVARWNVRDVSFDGAKLD